MGFAMISVNSGGREDKVSPFEVCARTAMGASEATGSHGAAARSVRRDSRKAVSSLELGWFAEFGARAEGCAVSVGFGTVSYGNRVTAPASGSFTSAREEIGSWEFDRFRLQNFTIPLLSAGLIVVR